MQHGKRNKPKSCMILEKAQPLSPMLTCSEPTFEGLCRYMIHGQPRIGIFSAEGGQFIGGHGMREENKLKTTAAFSELWDGTDINGALLDSLCAALGAQTVIENHLIEEMAGVIWRKKRLKKAEQTVYLEQDKESYSSHDVKQKLAKEHTLWPLMRYEIHLDRKLKRVLSVYYKLKELGSSSNHQS